MRMEVQLGSLSVLPGPAPPPGAGGMEGEQQDSKASPITTATTTTVTVNIYLIRVSAGFYMHLNVFTILKGKFREVQVHPAY